MAADFLRVLHGQVSYVASCESSMLCKRRNITRPMNDANNHDPIVMRHVINGVWSAERHAKARSEAVACWARKRKMPQGLKGPFDCLHKARRHCFRCLGRQRRPDFGEVGFGRVG